MGLLVKNEFLLFLNSTYQMSAAVVEVPPAPSNQESHDKLGDLVDKMVKVKVDGNVEDASDPEKIIKHPLQNAWTLWFFKNDKARTWEENQRPIITVTTVEDFWSLYNHIEVASRLPQDRITPFLKREFSLTGR